mmetsp:Transcript_26794/g.73730  ORF Transcript_26794/g.73730 Transcript_26794/m.73730 type:complete len:333 (-) Transcript_26794:262-1260(-)|eukprot:CAMPEP_0172368196 /NCGR_PEP_ID=MMETSP1060-20121228/25713_1 /TAXON_ID=37318 /ORGANISM="Pseudo-nitzschia pungens, Strain cf. cingulata" /LENGTH=332 /DNA_ID=CAMNT_0013092701 /DNA_START=72 /DNA_END=1070 /DNA_ORIENTATION=+
MQCVVSRSAIRRIQHHVARNRMKVCRSIASTTGGITRGGGRGRLQKNDVVANITNSTSNANFVAANRRYGSSNNSNDDDNGRSSQGSSELRRVYVHPLSQVVLEYLQDYHHSWVVSKGLDRSLTLHRDGSFEAKYVPLSPSSPTTTYHTYHSSTYSTLPPIPPANDDNKERAPNLRDRAEPIISSSTSATAAATDHKALVGGNTNTEPPASSSRHDNQNTSLHDSQMKRPFAEVVAIGMNNIRIWTSYDEQEKKHWLTVRKGLFRQRFLLQDNLLTTWQGNRGTSIPERIHVAVDEMIRAVDRMEQQQQAPSTMMGHHQQWQQRGQRRFRKR